MKTAFVSLLSSFLAVALVLPLAADEKKADEKKVDAPKAAAQKADAQKGADAKKPAGEKGAKGGQAVNMLLKRLEAAGLSEEQTAKIKSVAAEFAPKVAAAQQKQALTKDQQAAQKEAQAKAKADGLKGKAAQEAVNAALNLTEDQKAARAELQKLQAELNQAAMAVLTPEQKEKLGAKKPGQKKPAGEKKPAAKPAAKDAAK